MIAKHIMVFMMTAALDVVWARYTIATAARKPLPAALYAAAIFSIGGLIAVEYIAHPLLLVSAGAGAFVGTYYAVRLK